MAVLEGHAEDVWGIGLVTVGILGALALYGNALGPVGHWVHHGLGTVLGVGRFLVPLAFAAAGIMLIAGRPRHEPARACIGLGLILASVAGLADLAGGAPHFTASSTRLAGAGGVIGVAFGNPLRSGLGDWGASVVLLALVTLAFVLFTGVTIRAALAGVGRVARGLWQTVPGGRGRGRRVRRVRRGPGFRRDDGGACAVPDSGRPGARRCSTSTTRSGPSRCPTPPTARHRSPSPKHSRSPRSRSRPRVDASTPAPVPSKTPEAALSIDPGAATGDWRLPPMKLLSRSKPQELDRSEISRGGPRPGERPGGARGGDPVAGPHRRPDRHPLRARAGPRRQGGPRHQPGQGHRLCHGVGGRPHPGPDPGQVRHRGRGPQPHAPARDLG